MKNFHKPFALSAALFMSVFATNVSADSLYGTCLHSDGSKVDGTVTIVTNWNGKKAFPKKGEYRLDFGGKVGQKVDVYVNGSKYTTITVKGDTRLNIKLK